MSELAIASVKPQEWEQPFESPTAFRNGNLFPELQKPFFVEEEDSLEVMPKSGREDMLLQMARERYGTTVQMAEALGVDQSTISRKLKKRD